MNSAKSVHSWEIKWEEANRSKKSMKLLSVWTNFEPRYCKKNRCNSNLVDWPSCHNWSDRLVISPTQVVLRKTHYLRTIISNICPHQLLDFRNSWFLTQKNLIRVELIRCWFIHCCFELREMNIWVRKNVSFRNFDFWNELPRNQFKIQFESLTSTALVFIYFWHF